jgi:elongator complex protein 6
LEPDAILEKIERVVSEGVEKASSSGTRSVNLILDSPDVLLALNLATASQLSATLLRLRSRVHATILSCSADFPLLAAARHIAANHPSPLEVENAAFVMQQVHMALYVMSCRGLETGAAKDVSGVLRVTRGGGAYESVEDEGEGQTVKETDMLYLVHRDGMAKVFERGASAV